MKYSHQDVRRVEEARIKLRDQAAEQREIYDKHDDPASDDAQEALRKMRAIEVDLDKAEVEAAEVRAQVAEKDEILLKQARAMQYELDRRAGKLPRGMPGQNLDDFDPNAPIPNMTGSIDPAEDQAYREAFWNALKEEIPVQSRRGRSFLTAENREIIAKVEQRTMATTDTGANGGGNTVPKVFQNHLEEFLKFSGPCVPGGGLCYEFSTPGGEDHSVMTVDDTGQDGGVVAEDKRAVATKTTTANTDYIGDGTDPNWNRVTFKSKLYDSRFQPITYEMLMDTQLTDLERIVGGLLGKRLGRAINTAFTKTLVSGLLSANKITTATATEITPDELVELPHEIDPAYRGHNSSGGSISSNITTMMNDATYKYMRLMKVPLAGTKAEGYTFTPYMITQATDLLSGSPDRLLNMYGIRLNSAMDGVTTGKVSVIMGDFSNFWIRTIGDIRIITSSELYIRKLLLAMLAIQRCDAQMVNANSFAHILQK